MSALPRFRHDELRDFLVHVRDHHRVVTLSAWDGGPALIMRHDVDMDVLPAYELAALERECGVRSSFFVMITCPLYNALAPPNRAMLREMAAWGFEVGLHFDPAVHGGGTAGVLAPHVEAEAAILSSITGEPVRSVSLHNPALGGGYPQFAGYRNAYDPAIFEPDCYLSDSRRRFADDPRRFAERARDRAVQLLLHPMHYSADGEGYARIAGRFATRLIARIDRYFAVNETYRAEVRPDLLAVVRRDGEALAREAGAHRAPSPRGAGG